MTKEEQQISKNFVEDSAQGVVERILEEMEKMGDLPIFSASVNRVQMVSSDPSTDAMQLAVEILKDANLSSRVLKLANSPYFNRGVVKIGTLSRAIVLLGFDTIKSSVLTMKIVDSFQHDHPGVDMSSLLVNSYMSAGFVRDMAARSGLKDIEQSYVYGLFHNLGEIVTACILPEEYMQIKKLAKQDNMTWAQAQKEVLGMPFRKIGQEIAAKWEFPSSVAKTMNPYAFNEKGRIKNKVEMNQAIASLTSNMMDLLYSDAPNTKHSFSEITKELAKVTGVSKDSVTQCLDKSFKQSCELAEQFGLSKKLLKPKTNGTDDEERDKLARELSYYAVSQDEFDAGEPEPGDDFDDGYDDAPQELVEGSEQRAPVSSGDSNIMLSVLHELTTLMTQKAHINVVFSKVLEGMHRGVGFDRTMLILLTPDHKHYLGRMAVGHEAEALKQYFAKCSVNIQKDLFSKLIMEGTELLVPNVKEGGWNTMLPPDFETMGANTFILASIRVRGRPVGLFYGDKCRTQSPITPEDHRGFMQLVAQAQLALQVR
jgi:HD-like signal output (HDOD) protein